MNKVTKKPPNKKTKNKPLPRKYNRKPPELSPANVDRCYKILTLTGKITKLPEVLGVTIQTVHRWKKAFPDFGEAVTRALAEHKDLLNRDHPEMYLQAISVVKSLIKDRVMSETNTYSTRIRKVVFDKAKGEEEDIDCWQDKIVTKEYTREPSWTAIEKVIGKRDLRNAMMGILTDNTIQDKTTIIQQMFGKWMDNDELGGRWDGNIFNDIIDLMLIRTLQADTRSAFDKGELPIEEYSRLMAEQSKAYGYIVHNRETRAIKLLKGKSYSDIMDMIQLQNQAIINQIELVCNNVNIDRKAIASEVASKLQRLPEFKRISAWSELQSPRSANSKRK